jgi:hypothetical protein
MAARNLHHVRHLIGQDLVNQVNRIQQELTEQTDTVTNATLAGDTNRLRGIPAIGQGVSGHIPGTNPEDILLADT